MNDMIAVIAENTSKNFEELLRNDGFETIRIPRSPLLAPPVCTHVDMLILPIKNNIFCHELYAKEANEFLSVLEDLGYKITTVGGKYCAEYPHDVRFNAAVVGSNIFIGNRTDAKDICDYALANDLNIVRVKQGYAKCSTCIVSDNAIITADDTIETAAKGLGIDVLKIREGYVTLEGYLYGFIGGASGTCGDTVYFSGDLDLHPDGKAMIDFCKKHGKRALFIKGEELVDIGSVLFLQKYNAYY